MTYNILQTLKKDLRGTQDPTETAEILEEAINEIRAITLSEVSSWHRSRARLLGKRPGFITVQAKEEEKARAAENDFAADYFKGLPEVEAQKHDIALIGSDAQTTAFQLLYERPLGETNQQFLERAQDLIQTAIDAGKRQFEQETLQLEDGLPLGWRLEEIKLSGDKEKRFLAVLWGRGGLFSKAYGATTRRAVAEAKRKVLENVDIQGKEPLPDAAAI